MTINLSLITYKNQIDILLSMFFIKSLLSQIFILYFYKNSTTIWIIFEDLIKFGFLKKSCHRNGIN